MPEFCSKDEQNGAYCKQSRANAYKRPETQMSLYQPSTSTSTTYSTTYFTPHSKHNTNLYHQNDRQQPQSMGRPLKPQQHNRCPNHPNQECAQSRKVHLPPPSIHQIRPSTRRAPNQHPRKLGLRLSPSSPKAERKGEGETRKQLFLLKH